MLPLFWPEAISEALEALPEISASSTWSQSESSKPAPIRSFSCSSRTRATIFCLDAVAIAGMNKIPCIGFGPGNEIYAHTPNESSPLEHLSKAAAFYAGLICNLNEKWK